MALNLAGRSFEEIAREFERSAATICSWVKLAERDAGRRADVLNSAEREELRREPARLLCGAGRAVGGQPLEGLGARMEPKQVATVSSIMSRMSEPLIQASANARHAITSRSWASSGSSSAGTIPAVVLQPSAVCRPSTTKEKPSTYWRTKAPGSR